MSLIFAIADGCVAYGGMGVEIERKFLVVGEVPFGQATQEIKIVQGYLCSRAERTVRVRVAGSQAFLTIKGKPVSDVVLARAEYEYEIPLDDGLELLKMCRRLVEKTRYLIALESESNLFWEVDVFCGDNEGLVIAEIELTSEEQKFSRAAWIGEEVSADRGEFS